MNRPSLIVCLLTIRCVFSQTQICGIRLAGRTSVILAYSYPRSLMQASLSFGGVSLMRVISQIVDQARYQAPSAVPRAKTREGEPVRYSGSLALLNAHINYSHVSGRGHSRLCLGAPRHKPREGIHVIIWGVPTRHDLIRNSYAYDSAWD